MEVYLELMSIKDIPVNERPREKLVRYGSERLSDVELLAVIIGSGTANYSALDIAHDLINKHGLKHLINATTKELKQIKGVANVKAIKLHAIFEFYKRIQMAITEEKDEKISREFIFNKYSKLLSTYDYEVFGIIILDANGRVLREKILNKGSRHRVAITTQEVFKEMMMVDGKSFYIFHNHTGNSATPSDADIAFTSKLISEAKNLGFILLDHLIITKSSYFSFLKDIFPS